MVYGGVGGDICDGMWIQRLSDCVLHRLEVMVMMVTGCGWIMRVDGGIMIVGNVLMIDTRRC